MGVRVPPAHAEGSSLLPLVCEWMGSRSLPSRFLTCSRGGTRATTFGGVLYPQWEQGWPVPLDCPRADATGHLPCLSAAGGSSIRVDNSQLVPEGSASGSSPSVLLC